MNLIIPFTKDIKFNTSISEIVSVSLEHDYTVNDGEILGNFIISGDYKSHEVSVNKEHFEYVLPFSVELSTRIDRNSVDFNIEDFTYEVKDNNTLEVKIEYSINALEEKEEVKEEIEDKPLFERVEEDTTLEDMLDDIDENAKKNKDKENNMETEAIDNRDITEDDKKTIIDSTNETDDAFVTYHIHIMKETDTIDSVCTKYNTTSNILNEYNDLSTVAIGDKLIIPDINE